MYQIRLKHLLNFAPSFVRPLNAFIILIILRTSLESSCVSLATYFYAQCEHPQNRICAFKHKTGCSSICKHKLSALGL